MSEPSAEERATALVETIQMHYCSQVGEYGAVLCAEWTELRAAAALRAHAESARTEERERCAKIAIESSANCCTCSDNHVNLEIAAAIRAGATGER